MTLHRLGFVGVGRWAQKLATAFRECGAEIVAYDRGGDGEAPGFGARTTVQAMVHGDVCDAVIACAPPDVTTEVALECARAGKRCVATKPLLWTEWPDIFDRSHSAAPLNLDTGLRETGLLYVDLWRLYSPAWLALKEEVAGKLIEHIDVSFCGNGPFRSFNGVLDYGPHALAFVYDLLGTTELTVGRIEFDMADLIDVDMTCAGVPVRATIGNAAREPQRSVTVISGGRKHVFTEPSDAHIASVENVCHIDGETVVGSSKAHALRRFCRAFLVGEPSRTLEYSIAGMRVLKGLV